LCKAHYEQARRLIASTRFEWADLIAVGRATEGGRRGRPSSIALVAEEGRKRRVEEAMAGRGNQEASEGPPPR